MGDYLSLKALHVIGALLLVGNVTVTGFWAAFLYRRRGHDVGYRPIALGILWSDLIFTFGGGALLTITGILMVKAGQLDWRGTPWLWTGIVLLAASTLLWLVFLLPDQVRMERHDGTDDRTFRRHFLRWSAIGWFSTALLFAAVWFMVRKPGG